MTTLVDTYYAIDFDRCLSDTERLDEVFYELVRSYKELDGDQLMKSRKEIEVNGGSFDQVNAIRQVLPEEKVAKFLEEFVTRSTSLGVLSVGGADLVTALEKRNIPFGIVSFGSIDWQTAKIKASAVDHIPFLITDHTRKGEIIASWQQSDKTFLIPEQLTSGHTAVKASVVVLLDDKAGAFTGLPTEARGYWVQSVTGEILPSQQGTIPGNVRVAHGLGQVIEFESL